MELNIVFVSLTVFSCIGISYGQYTDVYNWKYHFPSGSGQGIYTALALPVPDSGEIDLFYAVFFEAYYGLPDNVTKLQFPPLIEDRAFNRHFIYLSIEDKIASKGYDGKSCLLKAICGASSFSTLHANGLIGDLIHLLLTPSSTSDHNDSALIKYKEAERVGRMTQVCDRYKCSISLLDLISFIQ